MLRVLVISLAVMGAMSDASTETDSCRREVNFSCQAGLSISELNACNAQYGAFASIANELQAYANLHLQRSYDFLLTSTYFSSYETNREGIASLFRKLSDDAWEKTIGLVKHITKRGGVMDFSSRGSHDKDLVKNTSVEVHEIGAMGEALDKYKVLAERAFHIHREATRKRDNLHDAEVAHYLEEEFMEKHAEVIRKLAGHVNDLKRFISEKTSESHERGNDMSLALYLFDEYLKKAE